LKFVASRIDVKIGPVFLFILDQVLHMSVVAAITLGIIYTGTATTPFLRLIAGYDQWILIIGGLIGGTTGVSILIFEMDRTFFTKDHDTTAVIDMRTRFVGIAERGTAISFILLGLPYLAPLAFLYSFFCLTKDRGKKSKKKDITDFCISAGSAFIIAFAVLWLR
jgi:hypothetical protein